MTNALLPILGGPPGAFARRDGVFFRPLPWAIGLGTVLFAVLYLRNLPCLTTDPGNPINAYIRLCHSDLSRSYNMNWSTGASPLGNQGMNVAPLEGVFIQIAVWFSGLLGAESGPHVDDATRFAGVPAFFAVVAILLCAAFIVLIIASAVLAQHQRRPWNVLLIAASPVVLASGMINWDLLAIALTALGIVALQFERPFQSGILLGLAASTANMPFAFVLAVVFVLLISARPQLWAFLGGLVPAWLLVHLPLLLARGLDPVLYYYVGQATKDVSYGSLWFLVQESGVQFRQFGAFAFILTVVALAALLAWIYVTGRRPGVGAMCAMVVLVVVLLAPAYPPQAGLWVLFALFVALPRAGESRGRGLQPAMLWVFSVVQVLHYLAVWGWIAGHLSRDGNGPWMLYYLAVLMRFATEVAMLVVLVHQTYHGAPDHEIRDAEDMSGTGEARVSV